MELASTPSSPRGSSVGHLRLCLQPAENRNRIAISDAGSRTLTGGTWLDGSISAFLNLHQATIEGCATADVGEPVGSEHIDVAGFGCELVPPDGWRPHHPAPRCALHLPRAQ